MPINNINREKSISFESESKNEKHIYCQYQKKGIYERRKAFLLFMHYDYSDTDFCRVCYGQQL